VEELTIAGRRIAADATPYVIAEIGANHNGDMELCRRTIDAAVAAGADAVKFQSWTKRSLVSRAELARNTVYARASGAPSLEQAIEQYQLSPAQYRAIHDYCDRAGIACFSSCFAREEVDLLQSLGAPAYKIASMDVNHLPLLTHVGQTRKPVLLSTGMATLGEVERALETLTAAGAPEVALLHCVSIYPTAPADANLRMLETWRRAFGVPVGYSDHTLGTAVPIAAIALGASILEKHFTLDRSLAGWDHAISADPAELRALVDGARSAHAALGSGVRAVSRAELDKRAVFRRRMVSVRAIRRGERLTPGDVEFKRPGTGIQPDELRYVVGRALVRDVEPDEELGWADLI
jgi:N-acetylneuraminate synthase